MSGAQHALGFPGPDALSSSVLTSVGELCLFYCNIYSIGLHATPETTKWHLTVSKTKKDLRTIPSRPRLPDDPAELKGSGLHLLH